MAPECLIGYELSLAGSVPGSLGATLDTFLVTRGLPSSSHSGASNICLAGSDYWSRMSSNSVNWGQSPYVVASTAEKAINWLVSSPGTSSS